MDRLVAVSTGAALAFLVFCGPAKAITAAEFLAASEDTAGVGHLEAISYLKGVVDTIFAVRGSGGLSACPDAAHGASYPEIEKVARLTINGVDPAKRGEIAAASMIAVSMLTAWHCVEPSYGFAPGSVK